MILPRSKREPKVGYQGCNSPRSVFRQEKTLIQDVAFFWEYFLRHLGDVRPFSDKEKAVYDKIRRGQDGREIEFNFYARDRLAEFCDERGVTFLDPLDVLKTNRETVFIDYLHYTKEGNRAMARFIYERMKETFHRRALMAREGARAVAGE